MASTSSSAAAAAMAQRASLQYLECRRSVTAKVDEVKLLDEQIATVFQQISALSEAPEGQKELSDEEKAAAKSVGRLEVLLLGVEGEEPVPNATITVTLDPEYEADEFETVEEVDEKKDVVVTDENGQVVEDGQVLKKNGEHTPRKLKKTTKITRTIIKKRVKKKEPVVCTIPWKADSKLEDGNESTALTFPASFIFDPVQSREAVVTITVAAASSDNEEEPDVVKEVEFPISSLFHNNVLDKWYTIVEEEEDDEPSAIPQAIEKTVSTFDENEAAKRENKKTDESENVEKAEETVGAEKVEDAGDSKKIEDADNNEASEKMEEIESIEQAEKTEDEAEADEKVEADGRNGKDVTDVKNEEPNPTGSRFHVKASFALSEAEKLSIAVVALSKKKQEAEATLQFLEREASSLRIKYDRLNASQRQLSTSGLSKPKSSLLANRFGVGGVPVQRKSWYQISYERTTSFVTKHQQLLVSVAMFTGSVCLFHYNGENLLA